MNFRSIIVASVVALVAGGCDSPEETAAVDGTWVGTVTMEGNVTTVVNESGSVWGGTAKLVEEASISGSDARDLQAVFQRAVLRSGRKRGELKHLNGVTRAVVLEIGRDQLGRMLSGGGFDPARDIEAITVNRWPHGYILGYDPTTDEVARTSEWPVRERPWLRARRPFGRISVANCGAANNAMTEASFSEAHRAIREVLGG